MKWFKNFRETFFLNHIKLVKRLRLWWKIYKLVIIFRVVSMQYLKTFFYVLLKFILNLCLQNCNDSKTFLGMILSGPKLLLFKWLFCRIASEFSINQMIWFEWMRFFKIIPSTWKYFEYAFLKEIYVEKKNKIRFRINGFEINIQNHVSNFIFESIVLVSYIFFNLLRLRLNFPLEATPKGFSFHEDFSC